MSSSSNPEAEMPVSQPMLCGHIAETERLIGRARTLLDRPEQEIVVNYLDHAVEALRIVSEQRTSPSERWAAALLT
jgi:hypothetical protein